MEPTSKGKQELFETTICTVDYSSHDQVHKVLCGKPKFCSNQQALVKP